MEETKELEGWFWPENLKKAHYYIGTRSICGRYSTLGLAENDVEQGNDDSSSNCAACKSAVTKRKAKQVQKNSE